MPRKPSLLIRIRLTLLIIAAATATFPGISEAYQGEQASTDFLADRLLAEDHSALLSDVMTHGNARRGALVFYRPELTCIKCHRDLDDAGKIGPVLAVESRETKALDLVRSILNPSLVIKQGYETTTVATEDGLVVSGQVVSEDGGVLRLRDQDNADRMIEIEIDAIEDRVASSKSLMPDGLVNVLDSRQEFLDLARYVIEIAEHGPTRAADLKPAAFLIATNPIPEYESRVDHAGLIGDWDRESFKRGEEVYQTLCINCHGTVEKAGSLPTSLRFASGKFKNGSDPLQMYKTLTHGFGLMVGQSWMVPEQKYDVIHYIREAYLKPHNAEQYTNVDEAYLASLPVGNTRGPKPVKYEPWALMNYGPTMAGTFEFGKDGTNFAYKGVAVRLDPGPGGVSRGNQWIVFDHDTMRVAGVWTGQGFIDWNGIHFNGRHGIHPRAVGTIQLENPIGPGWANPETGTFDDPRIVGRDGKLYGPLPRDWAHYRGMYHYADHAIFDYTVGDTEVLEMPGMERSGDLSVISRTFNIGPRPKEMTLQVLDTRENGWNVVALDEQEDSSRASRIALQYGDQAVADTTTLANRFDGSQWVKVENGDAFNMYDEDFTIVANLRTRSGGTIFCKTAPQEEWVPNGKSLFVRGGRLCFDIGWVGVVQTGRRINDGKWHQVAMTYRADEGQVELYIDGKREGQGELKAEDPVSEHILRLGYTSENFPGDPRCFEGDLSRIRFYQRRATESELAESYAAFDPDSNAQPRTNNSSDMTSNLVADWEFNSVTDDKVVDLSDNEMHGKLVLGTTTTKSEGDLLVGVSPGLTGHQWSLSEKGQLRLTIPAGREPLRFSLCFTTGVKADVEEAFATTTSLNEQGFDLAGLMQGGPPRWPNELERSIAIESTDGPFAVDVFEHPVNNPWQALVRLSGFDFFPDGDRMAVSSWDGDVWLVSGLKAVAAIESGEADGFEVPTLRWKRIASGMFQPLGVKIVNNDIYVTCRDQLCILRDLNGDGETDRYESFNNDHQVTEHFHEFAMGLQQDNEGNFYYAKSARHALTALVPHHGTLLRVSKDGSKTEIVATGFRAANGVCINPDGSFIVTDQEGHWNPKNRINWVREGGFYGNMFGYHDVTDSSDEAMDQPLCWITNAFDRSPAELLWVDSEAWGPLNGQLLNLSYGYGKIFVVPHEEIDGQMQGGMCQLPIDKLPTGVMRGRFNPVDGQLYCCGLFAWAGSQTQPGGFYRLRYTGKPVHLPVELKAREGGVELRFSGKLTREVASDPRSFQVETWSLKRTASYGSQHYDTEKLEVKNATVSDDGQSVFLEISNLKPTWCMEIKYNLRSDDNRAFKGVIHNTIHALQGEPFSD